MMALPFLGAKRKENDCLGLRKRGNRRFFTPKSGRAIIFGRFSMATRRKSITLYEHERRQLIEQYLRWQIPIDQFESRPSDLQAFVEEWQQQSGRKDSAGELIHYMRTKRKCGLWVRLEENCQPVPSAPVLSAEETEALVKIFYCNVTALESGSDVLAYDEETAALIAKEFSSEVGRVVPAHVLVTKLTALRKRGLLPKVGNRRVTEKDIGFSDIDEAVG